MLSEMAADASTEADTQLICARSSLSKGFETTDTLTHLRAHNSKHSQHVMVVRFRTVFTVAERRLTLVVTFSDSVYRWSCHQSEAFLWIIKSHPLVSSVLDSVSHKNSLFIYEWNILRCLPDT